MSKPCSGAVTAGFESLRAGGLAHWRNQLSTLPGAGDALALQKPAFASSPAAVRFISEKPKERQPRVLPD